MSEIKLKPCPFCGGEAEWRQTSYGTSERASVKLSFSIRCKKCGSTMSRSYGYICINIGSQGNLNVWHDDREKAAEAWNRRANNE